MLGKYLPPQEEQKTEEKEKKLVTSKFFEVECIGKPSFGNSFIDNSS